MRNLISSLSLILTFTCFGQPGQNDRDKSLDDFFAGIPIQQDFRNWVSYVIRNPYLGIDSVEERGIYSSFKKGIKSYFPFEDSQTVKLLFKKTILYDSLTNKNTDSISVLQIEGVFPDNKEGKKRSKKIYATIRKALDANYRRRDYDYSGNFPTASYSKGKSDSFPESFLYQGYSKELEFYFVIILFTNPPGKTKLGGLELDDL